MRKGHPDDYMGTSRISKRTPLGPYRRPVPRALGGSQGAGRFLKGEVTLYHARALIGVAKVNFRRGLGDANSRKRSQRGFTASESNPLRQSGVVRRRAAPVNLG